MSNTTLIKKHFKFLKQYGFNRKIFTKNGDCEVLYSNKKVLIEINCELGVPYFSLSNNYNEAIESSLYTVSVLIKYGFQGGNILYCDLFDKKSRVNLKSDIESVENHNIEPTLLIYSQFIKDNMDKIIQV